MIKIPSTTNSVTFSMICRDEADAVRWQAINIPVNANTVLKELGPLKAGWSIYMKASGDTGTAITISVELFLYRDLEE